MIREIINGISEDLDELEYLMAIKRKLETEIENFKNIRKEKEVE